MSGASHGGKGDKARPYDKKTWDSNWDKIFKKSSGFLFLDDFRMPKDGFLHDENKWLSDASQIPNGSWDIVRSFQEFKEHILAHGVPKIVSWDVDLTQQHMKYYMKNHDTGMWDWRELEATGVHCCVWLKQYCEEKGVDFPKWFIHSANHMGRLALRKILTTI